MPGVKILDTSQVAFLELIDGCLCHRILTVIKISQDFTKAQSFHILLIVDRKLL